MRLVRINSRQTKLAEIYVTAERTNLNMEITTVIKDDEAVLSLSGQLNTMTSEQLYDALMPLAENGDKDILLDFQELDYVSSAGLRVLLTAQNEIEDREINMSVCNVCDDVAEVFEMTGFNEILTIK